MDVFDLLDGLDLNDDLPLDDEVEHVPSDLLAIVKDPHRELPPEGQSSFAQFEAKGILVHLLEKAWT